MYLAINGTEIPIYPAPGGYSVTILDLDNADNTYRTANGQMSRDRVAVKRQIEMTFNAMKTETQSALLRAMSDEFFSFTYLDTMTGRQATRTFYVGDRTSTVPVIDENGECWWEGLRLTLTEQ